MLKRITLSAEETLIEKARQKALAENSTLNAEFRRWLVQYTQSTQRKSDFAALMAQVGYAQPGRVFRRDELNER